MPKEWEPGLPFQLAVLGQVQKRTVCHPVGRRDGTVTPPHQQWPSKWSTYTEVCGLGCFLPLSLWPWWNLGPGITLLPTPAIEWDQLVFLDGRLANRAGWGTLPGLHPLMGETQWLANRRTLTHCICTYSVNARPTDHQVAVHQGKKTWADTNERNRMKYF